jgi:hypothetical protein
MIFYACHSFVSQMVPRSSQFLKYKNFVAVLQDVFHHLFSIGNNSIKSI